MTDGRLLSFILHPSNKFMCPRDAQFRGAMSSLRHHCGTQYVGVSMGIFTG